MNKMIKYLFFPLLSLFFFSGCTTSTTVGVGVYGGYGYPYYGYGGGYYYGGGSYYRPPNRPDRPRPEHPIERPRPEQPIARPDRPTTRPSTRPSSRPSRSMSSMGRPSGMGMRRR